MSGSEGNAARSMVKRAGEEAMLPRRVMRRPAWSEGLGEWGIGRGNLGRTLIKEAIELEAWDEGFCSGGALLWLGHCYSWTNC